MVICVLSERVIFKLMPRSISDGSCLHILPIPSVAGLFPGDRNILIAVTLSLHGNMQFVEIQCAFPKIGPMPYFRLTDSGSDGQLH